MGYYTRYALSVKDASSDNLYVVSEWIRSKHLYGFTPQPNKWTRSDGTVYDEYECTTEMKWYNNKEDLVELSKRVPNCTFMLEWQGEDEDDFGKVYFKNGEHEYCYGKMVIPEPTTIEW